MKETFESLLLIKQNSFVYVPSNCSGRTLNIAVIKKIKKDIFKKITVTLTEIVLIQ